jgi:antitoxin (DNA-binding transcriptional repressor) of toxin-antitoxin stability system
MSDIIFEIDNTESDLLQYLDGLTPVDRIILCKRSRPIAEVRLLPERASKVRRLGVAKGEFTVPATFFEPLPAEILDAFEGR